MAREQVSWQGKLLPPSVHCGGWFCVCSPHLHLLWFMAVVSSLRRLWLPAALAWGVFGTMGVLVARYGQAPFDDPLLLALHRHATPALDGLAIFFTIAGNTGPMVAAGVLTTAALARAGRRRDAWLFAAGLGGSMLLTQAIKFFATRPRPSLWVSIRPEHTFSFPSGHAMDTAALAAALFFVLPRHRQRC
ncbi:MAG: phosphatase PAP2 family protein, partial [Hymenobacter sp.]